MSPDQQTEARLRAQLEHERKRLGLTHAEIARRLGISPPAVTRVLTRKGAVIPQSLIDVLDVLGLQVTLEPKETHSEDDATS